MEVYGTDARAAKYVEYLQVPQKLCLAIGSEADGLSELWRVASRQLLAVRTAGAVESLNVAAATAIAVHIIAGKLGVI
jgi:tRNA G18 (ribose-2'-O)-methylase SpoU